MKLSALLFSFILMVGAPTFGVSQTPTTSPTPKLKLTNDAKIAREHCLTMLDEMKKILEEVYYDDKMRGIDLKARIDAAKARVKMMEFNWQMYRVIVQVLMDFDDSHTRVSLPGRTDHFSYGVSWQMIGSELFVKAVEKDSDALKKGVEIGDQIEKIGKFTPNRNDLWKMEYLIFRLDPGNTIDLTIKKPSGETKEVTITAKTYTDKEYRAMMKARLEKLKKDETRAYRCVEISAEVAACKLYSFSVERNVIDKIMSFAKKYPKLILDLRGNGGGLVTTQRYLASHFFPEKTRLFNMVTRKESEQQITDVLEKDRQYTGEVTVLIDSRSASAAEITARVFQIEKRGTVLGDVSSGSVMTSIYVPFRSLMGAMADAAVIYAGMSVTIGDVIMRDGTRIEKVGVVPDEVLQPTGLAIKMKLDLVLAYAALKYGAKLSAVDAGKLDFFIPYEDDDTPGDQKDGVN